MPPGWWRDGATRHRSTRSMRSLATIWPRSCADARAGNAAIRSAPMNSSRIGDPLRILLLRSGAGAENRLAKVVDEGVGVADVRPVVAPPRIVALRHAHGQC